MYYLAKRTYKILFLFLYAEHYINDAKCLHLPWNLMSVKGPQQHPVGDNQCNSGSGPRTARAFCLGKH